MSQDSSLVGAFDLKSQSGVMLVLAAIRASKLSPAEKNELRDLVFTYSNGGGDITVKNLLEQKLNAHQISPVGRQRAGKPVPTLSFGTYRPTPEFKTSLEVTPLQTPTPAPVFYKNTAPDQVGAANNPTSTIQQSVVNSQPPYITQEQQVPVTPPPVYQTPQPSASAVAPEVNIVEAHPPLQNATPQPQPKFQSQPVGPTTVASSNQQTPQQSPISTPPPTTTTPAVGNGTESVYLERIRQIKTAVNSKVGNPVNLVDINNEVGREYMNALLEAMKKLSSGAVSEMEPAMARLESAFKAVEVAIVVHRDTGGLPKNPPVTPTPTPTPSVSPVAPIPQSPKVAEHTQQTTPAPTPSVLPTPPIPPVAPIPQAPPASTPLPARNVPVPPVSTQPIPPTPSSTHAPVFPPPIPTATDKNEEDRSSAWANTANVEKADGVKVVDNRATSLADSAKILTPHDLADPATLETGNKGDPLATKEVDDGLNQLLSDWSLFKKSGLFGTGPKGREHPLFKKIADLQVPLLLAGRFEGASQEIRQSITDYMNGWRYEQGIVYMPGETFEKYLRRVIKHILDLQKKKQTP